MIIAGIDTGVSGAIVLLSSNDYSGSRIWDMPVKDKRVDPKALASIFLQNPIDNAFIEDSWSRPNQGVAGMDAMIKSYAYIIGIVCALRIPYNVVAPITWKTLLGVTSDKKQARKRATVLMPKLADNWVLNKHHNRAEAALIAYYGAHQMSPLSNREQLYAL